MKFKKFLLLFYIFIFCISICSCSNKTKDDTITDPTDIFNEDNLIDNQEPQSNSFPTYDDIKKQYSDKTILVWAIEETGYERNFPFRAKEVNEYLDEKGYDFVVCFLPIRALQSEKKDDFYTKYVSDMVQNGENIDIIYSSFTYIEEPGNNAYHKYIYNGLLNLWMIISKQNQAKNCMKLCLKITGKVCG